MGNTIVNLDKSAQEELKKIIGKGETEIIEVTKLPSMWKGTPIPNEGHVDKIYFNTNISTNNVIDIISKLTYIGDPEDPDGDGYKFYNIIEAENASESEIGYYIMNQDNMYVIYGFNSETDALIFAYNLPDTSDGWQNIKELSIDENVVSESAELPGSVGAENNLLSSIFSVTPFENLTEVDESKIYKLNDNGVYSYWRYVNDQWIEVIKDFGRDIATNTTNISTNTTNIATNKQDIATNKQDIATNTTNIAKNAGDIAKNKQDITDLKGGGIKGIIAAETNDNYVILVTYTDGQEERCEFSKPGQWIKGSNDPEKKEGRNGDYYFDIYHNNIWMKEEGIWSLIVDFTDDEQTYTVLFLLNDSLREKAQMPEGYDKSVTIKRGEYFGVNGNQSLPIPSRDGYIFKGWYLTENPTLINGAFTDTAPVFSDLTLYANWEKIV